MNINKEEEKQVEREESKEGHVQVETQNLNPQRFLAKIPNIRVLRDFLVNKGGYYVPPIRDLTNDFCRVTLTYLL